MGPVIALRDGTPAFSIGAAGGSTIITTILQILINHVDVGMSLPAALAAPRVSQRNLPTSLAEPLFYHSALAQQLTSQFGEKFTEATGRSCPWTITRGTRPRCSTSAAAGSNRSPSPSAWAAAARSSCVPRPDHAAGTRPTRSGPRRAGPVS